MFRVAFLSDTHLAREAGTEPTSPDAMLGRAVEAVVGYRADLIVLPGDVADDGSHEAYGRVRDTVAVLGAPVLATPGNHDLAGPMREVLGGAADHAGDGWRVVLVDTFVEQEVHGRVDVATVAVVLGPDEGRPTVLVVHHPPITLSSHRWFQLDGATDLLTLLSSRTDVRVVVSGHLHQDFDVAHGGVVFLGCPSTYYALEHHHDRWQKVDGVVGALVLELADDGAFDWHLVPSRPAA